jgi:hypothetical protein
LFPAAVWLMRLVLLMMLAGLLMLVWLVWLMRLVLLMMLAGLLMLVWLVWLMRLVRLVRLVLCLQTHPSWRLPLPHLPVSNVTCLLS